MSRFIVTEGYTAARGYHNTVVLKDLKYFEEHKAEFAEWCTQFSCVQEGNFGLSVPDDDTLTMFILRWS